MSGDDRELVTQQRVLQLFREKLKYKYIGNLREQENSNIIETKLKEYLLGQGYSEELCRRAINSLTAASRISDLTEANRAVYSLLHYGSSEQEHVGVPHQTVNFINWVKPL